MIANIVEYLSSKKTKHAVVASIPLILAGLAGEMSWLQVAIGVAGAFTAAGVGQAVADAGKEKAKVEAQAAVDVAEVIANGKTQADKSAGLSKLK